MSSELNHMSNESLIKTLKIAAESVNDNIALSMLLVIAAERIMELSDAGQE